MSIVKRAVQEAKDISRLSVDAAKNELIEQLSPEIQRIVERQLRSGVLKEDADRLRRAADGYGDDFEEGKDMGKNDKMESISSMFPGVNEVAEDDMDEAKTDGNSGDDEGYDDVNEETEEVDEELEISNEELESIYREALQLEVSVEKGFKDMARPHEFGAGVKGEYQSDPGNLTDMKSGEAQWDNVLPPDKKDFTVKEQVRKLVKQGLEENRKLSNENKKLMKIVKQLHGKLKETNLLNAKILHVNKFMSANKLTNEQKRSVIESIDKGSTVSEVKNIYSVIEKSFKAAGVVSESRNKPRADNQKERRQGGADPKVLRESADRSGTGAATSRWQQLAGLSKLTNG